MLSIVCPSFQLTLLSNLLTISRSLVCSPLEVSLTIPLVVVPTFRLLSLLLILEVMLRLCLRIPKMPCSHGTLMDIISSSWGKFLMFILQLHRKPDFTNLLLLLVQSSSDFQVPLLSWSCVVQQDGWRTMDTCQQIDLQFKRHDLSMYRSGSGRSDLISSVENQTSWFRFVHQDPGYVLFL